MAAMPQVLMLPVSNEIVTKIAEELVRKWIVTLPTANEADALTVGSTLDGGKFAGITVRDGRPMRLVLLPGDFSGTWEEVKAWCAEQSGVLPSRFDLLTLWQNVRTEFQQDAYWSDEAHHSAASSAWYQSFTTGYQTTSPKTTKLRARAVRRLAI